jgi:hypothetical protein
VRIVIDTSVIVSAIKPEEVFHDQSVAFLERVRQWGDEIWTPMTQLWEIGAALDHPGKTRSGRDGFGSAQPRFHPAEEGAHGTLTVLQARRR